MQLIEQRATIVNGAPTTEAPGGTNTRWSLSPKVAGVFLPLNLAYLVAYCDTSDYSSTIIGVPDRSILYVMTRTPTPEPEVRDALLDRCKHLGYNMRKVVNVEHDYTWVSPPTPPEQQMKTS